MRHVRFNAWKHVRSFCLFSSWDVWRWRIARTVWHTRKKKLRQGYSSTCVGVEWVSYQTALKRRMASAACSWTKTTVPIHLHSAVKPVQRKKQLRSAEDGNSRCFMCCEPISSPKPVIYNICQNCCTISIYRARAKQKKKRKKIVCLHDELIPQQGEHRRGKGKKNIPPLWRNFDPDAHLCFVSIKIPKDLWEEYWVFAQTTSRAGHFIYPTWEQRRKWSTLSSTSACLWGLCLCGLNKKRPTHRAHSCCMWA